MKRWTIVLCALIAIAVGAQFVLVLSTSRECSKHSQTVQTEYAYDGMFFSTVNVVDNICYGTERNGAWYLIYDDADAGLFYTAIRVTRNTYLKVVEALENKQELCGVLYATQEYETIEYELEY